MNYHLTNSRETLSIQGFTCYLLSDIAPKLFDPARDLTSAFQSICAFFTVAVCFVAVLFLLYAAVDTFLIHKATH